MDYRFLLAIVLGAGLLAGCGAENAGSSLEEAWNDINDPLNLSSDYERRFADLPLSGRLEVTPWTDTYWPSYRGGISDRWNDDGAEPFFYGSPSKDEALAMSLSELAVLSPAEKYDLFVGRYDFPLVEIERGRTSPDNQHWEGICHGWAPAAIHFDEPRPVTVTSVDGIEIPFGSSDVKALLSYYQGQMSHARFRALGARCNQDLDRYPDAASHPECRDTNAGAFHVVLANQIGLMGEGFVADVTRDYQVWNQPVHGFESRVLREQEPSPGAAEGTVREVFLETRMSYTVEVEARWEALLGTGGHRDRTETYRYRLELAQDGEVLGGEWLSESRPDFLWTQERPEFDGLFDDLGLLYEQSIRSEGFPNPVR